MSRTFEGMIEHLCSQTGYDYDYLVDRFDEVMADDGEIEYFIGVTLEKDW